MTTIYADRKMPNTGGWQDRHDAAVDGVNPRPFEQVAGMIQGWAAYACAHKARYDSPIGDDGVMGDYWESMGDALRGLLNGETGRLDCGTLDGFILKTMKEHGINTETK
jgi:hypothetical protein